VVLLLFDLLLFALLLIDLLLFDLLFFDLLLFDLLLLVVLLLFVLLLIVLLLIVLLLVVLPLKFTNAALPVNGNLIFIGETIKGDLFALMGSLHSNVFAKKHVELGVSLSTKENGI
jgi:hypothetical protein